jgi:Zn-dependent protease/predicted transcriptional regulator
MTTPRRDAPPSRASSETERHPWAIRIGRILGIPIDVHVTFLVLLAWIALGPIASGGSLEEGMESAGFTALVFATVVFHELGHASVARRFGFETTRILLLPIGGIATLTRLPTRPLEELLVAIAGPIVNVLLAIAIGIVLFFFDRSVGLTGATLVGGPMLLRLLWVNLGLAAFNLLPAFPMDGGRALRALLSVFMERGRATRIAVAVGRALALVLGVVGLALQPMLALIALFVWSAGRLEVASEETREAIAGVTVGRVMTKHVDVLPGDASLALVAERILADRPHDFVVEEGGEVVGLLTRGDVLRGLARGDMSVLVDGLMHRDFATASPDELLEDTLPRLEASGRHTMVVLDGKQLVGVVDAENLGELLMLERARRAATSRDPIAKAA